MQKVRALLKSYLRDVVIVFRNNEELTQEEFAGLLHISSRSYSDLECGRYCFSSVTLILFLNLLPDDGILGVVHGFQDILAEAEKRGAA